MGPHREILSLSGHSLAESATGRLKCEVGGGGPKFARRAETQPPSQICSAFHAVIPVGRGVPGLDRAALISATSRYVEYVEYRLPDTRRSLEQIRSSRRIFVSKPVPRCE
jgi:hypothetical protein